MVEGDPYEEVALLEEVDVPEVLQLDQVLKDRSVSHCAILILIKFIPLTADKREDINLISFLMSLFNGGEFHLLFRLLRLWGADFLLFALRSLTMQGCKAILAFKALLADGASRKD